MEEKHIRIYWKISKAHHPHYEDVATMKEAFIKIDELKRDGWFVRAIIR